MDSYDTELFWELVGYVSEDACTCELIGLESRPCLTCRARENYEAHKKHLQEAEAVPKKRVVFDLASEDIPSDEWVDRCADLTREFRVLFGAAMERVLADIGPERVSHIAYPPPPNPSLKRQIVGHSGELLGEVWVEWPKPGSRAYEITVKGRYHPGKGGT